MKRLALLVAALAALCAPSVASAGGGMAVVALNRPLAGIVAGDAWIARISVVSCGGFAAGYTPSLTISDRASGRAVTFRGRPTERQGIYEARVIFPAAGAWSYEVAVNPGFSRSYGPVRVAPPRRAPARLVAALPPVGAMLLVFGTGLVLRRRKA